MEGRQPASLAVRLAGFRQAARCLREAASQDAGVGEGPDPRQRFRTWLQREGRRVQGGNPERCRWVLEQHGKEGTKKIRNQKERQAGLHSPLAYIPKGFRKRKNASLDYSRTGTAPDGPPSAG